MSVLLNSLAIFYLCFVSFSLAIPTPESDEPIPSPAAQNSPPGVSDFQNFQVSNETCSSLESEIRGNVLKENWSLENFKLQKRLINFPRYIATIEGVSFPSGGPNLRLDCDKRGFVFSFGKVELLANNVGLFDDYSILPIHTGSMNIQLQLKSPLIVPISQMKGNLLRRGILFLNAATEDSLGANSNNNEQIFSYNSEGTLVKEHRAGFSDNEESSDPATQIESEIEEIFIRRIGPFIQDQIIKIIMRSVRKYFSKIY